MSSGRNPFAHLIPSQSNDSGIVGLDDSDSLAEIEKWRQRGRIGGASIKQYINPTEGREIPRQPQVMQPEQQQASMPSAQEPQQPATNPFVNLIPKKVDTFLGQIPASMPEFQQGTPQQAETLENLIGGLSGAPGINVLGKAATGAGSALAKSGINWFKSLKIDPKKLVKFAQDKHDKLSKQASNIYEFVKNEVGPRGVGNIDVDHALIDQAERFLPNTRANQQLIKNAKSGSYESIHKLQSDIGKKATEKMGSKFGADRDLGETMMDLREKLNESIIKKFDDYGHPDLSKMLQEANGKYRHLKETYYKHPALSKMVSSGLRKVPKNPMSVFSEESEPMAKFLSEHPDIKKAVDVHNAAKATGGKLNLAKNVGLGAASTIGLEEFIRRLI